MKNQYITFVTVISRWLLLLLMTFCSVSLAAPAPAPAPETEMEAEEKPETDPSADQTTNQALTICPSVEETATNEVEQDSGASVYYRWALPVKEEDEKESDADACSPEAQAMAQLEKKHNDALSALATIEGKFYPNKMMFEYALNALEIKDQEARNDILLLSRVSAAAPLTELNVAVDGCGCSRDFSSLVYGFYPYWLAEDDKAQQIDFSVFDRIAYYAVALDERGNIENAYQWSDDWNAAEFIKKAHKYRVDVDLTVYANGWQTWDEKLLERATRATANAVTQQYTNANTKVTAQADGVTLVFQDYGISTDKGNVIKFVAALEKTLATKERDYQINILLDLDITQLAGKTDFEDITAILLGSKEQAAAVDNVFVFLQEQTTHTKKLLRSAIENEFRGADRVSVLQKVVPILSSQGHMNDPQGAFIQFTDDLIYLKENFAGAGLWPLPLDSEPDTAMIKTKIIDLYTDTDDDNYLGQLLNQYVPKLCEIACPNRWVLRIAFDVLAALLVAYALLALWLYSLRKFFNAYSIYFAAYILGTIVIFIVSMVCDPFWQERANAVVLGIILAIIVITIINYISKVKRPPLP